MITIWNKCNKYFLQYSLGLNSTGTIASINYNIESNDQQHLSTNKRKAKSKPKCILTDALSKFKRNDEDIDDIDTSETAQQNIIVTHDINAEQHFNDVQNENDKDLHSEFNEFLMECFNDPIVPPLPIKRIKNPNKKKYEKLHKLTSEIEEEEFKFEDHVINETPIKQHQHLQNKIILLQTI